MRQIGERAGVDPALIARYFDGKEGLFLAACATPAADEVELPADPHELVAWLLERSPAMLPIPGTSSVEHLEQNVGAVRIELG